MARRKRPIAVIYLTLLQRVTTRMGHGSKIVVTGDITQVDLPLGKMSGLIEARHVISGVEGISFIHFNERDVVRHPLVQRIVRAYESYSAQNIASQQSLQFGQDGAFT